MVDAPRAVTWDAPEHHHFERSGDWFWALGIVGIASAVAVFMLGNTIFAIFIIIATGIVGIIANQEPQIVPHAVTARGVRIGNELYPYSTLVSFYIEEELYDEPQLLVRSSRSFMPLLVLPIPEEYQEEIEALLSQRLPEEHLEEPFMNKLLEFLGF